jgi:GNAT superfamily N-acetyltransferase
VTDAILVRPLQPGDRDAWNPLWQGYLDFYAEALSPAITDLTWSRLLDDAQPLHGLIALEGANVVGFVHYLFHPSTWSANGYCYLEDLFVAETTRGRGAGRTLIEAVYAAADRENVSRVYWHTTTTNARARHLYDSLATLTPFVQYRR